MPLYRRGGSSLPTGGAPGQVLAKTDDGETVWIEPTGGLFRGDWQSDTLARQFDFAVTGLEGFTTSAVGPDSVAAILRPTNDLSHLTSEPSEPTGTPDPLFTRAAKLRTRTRHGLDAGGSRTVVQTSELSLNLSTLGIAGISRVECWFASRSAYAQHQRNYVGVNGVERFSQSADVNWTNVNVSATSSDVVTWGVRSGNNLYDSIIVAGVSAVKIFASEAPYMLGEFVTHGGKMWKSAMDFNIQTPGVDTSWVLALELPQPSGTTAQRPDAATAGAGYPYFDTTLNKPVWSNGTAWVDATGTAV